MRPLVLLAILTLAAVTARAQTPFTYQGVLAVDGQPVTTATDLRFRLFPAASGGSQIGADNVVTLTPGDQGRFVAALDFGAAFGPDARYLQIAARPAWNGVGAEPPFTVLAPRTPLTAAPTAHYAHAAPTPPLDAVTQGLATVTPGEYIDVAADGAFSKGLRFSDAGASLIVALPGIRATNHMLFESTGNRMQLKSPIEIELAVATSTLTVGPTEIELSPSIVIDANASIIDLDASALLSLNAPTVQLAGGSTLINGHSFMSSHVGIAGTLNVTGSAFKPGGGPWGSLSDARLKRNINPLSGSLDALKRLRPVTFEYKPGHPLAASGLYRGFIAQDVLPIFPEWVTADENGVLLLTPVGFEALVVDAIQELEEDHRRELDTLKKEHHDLQDRVKRLERTVRRLADTPG